MSPTQVLAMSALGAAPLAAEMLLGRRGPWRPPFNLVISNVPGPTAPLYWNGARLDALHPLSIPTDGQALNITAASSDDQLSFGLTACRRTVPHLDPLLDHLDTDLAAWKPRSASDQTPTTPVRIAGAHRQPGRRRCRREGQPPRRDRPHLTGTDRQLEPITDSRSEHFNPGRNRFP